jgi:hypothetical protein
VNYSNVLGHYVREARQVERVRFVFALNDHILEVFTGLDRRNLRACHRLFRIETEIRQTWESLSIDFHIIYAGSRPLDEIVGPRDSVLYVWERQD